MMASLCCIRCIRCMLCFLFLCSCFINADSYPEREIVEFINDRLMAADSSSQMHRRKAFKAFTPRLVSLLRQGKRDFRTDKMKSPLVQSFKIMAALEQEMKQSSNQMKGSLQKRNEEYYLDIDWQKFFYKPGMNEAEIRHVLQRWDSFDSSDLMTRFWASTTKSPHDYFDLIRDILDYDAAFDRKSNKKVKELKTLLEKPDHVLSAPEIRAIAKEWNRRFHPDKGQQVEIISPEFKKTKWDLINKKIDWVNEIHFPQVNEESPLRLPHHSEKLEELYEKIEEYCRANQCDMKARMIWMKLPDITDEIKEIFDDQGRIKSEITLLEAILNGENVASALSSYNFEVIKLSEFFKRELTVLDRIKMFFPVEVWIEWGIEERMNSINCMRKEVLKHRNMIWKNSGTILMNSVWKNIQPKVPLIEQMKKHLSLQNLKNHIVAITLPNSVSGASIPKSPNSVPIDSNRNSMRGESKMPGVDIGSVLPIK